MVTIASRQCTRCRDQFQYFVTFDDPCAEGQPCCPVCATKNMSAAEKRKDLTKIRWPATLEAIRILIPGDCCLDCWLVPGIFPLNARLALAPLAFTQPRASFAEIGQGAWLLGA